MLGYLWMLRNEAARVLDAWLNGKHDKPTTAVGEVIYAALYVEFQNKKDCMHSAAHALLTAHNVEPRDLTKGETG